MTSCIYIHVHLQPNKMNYTPTRLIQEIKTIANTNEFTQDIAMINGYVGISPISVQPELYTLILKSIRLKELTDGAFDIFDRNGAAATFDTKIEINPLLLSVYLPFSDMKISQRTINQLDIN